MVDHVGGFGGGHVVRFRAHAADAVGQQGHLLHRAANAEALEAAQLGDLEVGVGDVALLVQEDFDLTVAFQAGDGINRDSLCHSCLLLREINLALLATPSPTLVSPLLTATPPG